MDNVTTAKTAGASTVLVSGIMFGVSMLATLAFGFALLTDPSRIADAWVWVRGLPLAVQLGLWAIFLPWMVALWTWSLPLAVGIRVAIIVVVLGAAEYLLFPWKR